MLSFLRSLNVLRANSSCSGSSGLFDAVVGAVDLEMRAGGASCLIFFLFGDFFTTTEAVRFGGIDSVDVRVAFFIFFLLPRDFWFGTGFGMASTAVAVQNLLVHAAAMNCGL